MILLYDTTHYGQPEGGIVLHLPHTPVVLNHGLHGPMVDHGVHMKISTTASTGGARPHLDNPRPPPPCAFHSGSRSASPGVLKRLDVASTSPTQEGATGQDGGALAALSFFRTPKYPIRLQG
jgi:hypothetical protein